MSWKPADYIEKLPGLFALKCPYCHDDAGEYRRTVDSAMPDPQVCSSCDRTFIIPVTVSRGGKE